jgi:beta-catenin-like protein 1
LENVLDEEAEFTSNKLMGVDALLNWLVTFLER